MIVSKKEADMAIVPSHIKAEKDIKKLFREYETYQDLLDTVEWLKIDPILLVKYIVYLYSEDSILNIRPPMPLDERQARALEMSGLGKMDADWVKKYVLELQDRRVFEFIFEYLTKQKRFTWQEIITLETQILENQKLRLRPVDEESGKDELMAFEKKGKMTIMYKEWYSTLKEFYDDFYGDNQNVRAIHRINRANMASLENISF